MRRHVRRFWRPMNQNEIKELVEFLVEKDIAEFELERGDVKIRIKRPQPVVSASGTTSGTASGTALRSALPSARCPHRSPRRNSGVGLRRQSLPHAAERGRC